MLDKRTELTERLAVSSKSGPCVFVSPPLLQLLLQLLLLILVFFFLVCLSFFLLFKDSKLPPLFIKVKTTGTLQCLRKKQTRYDDRDPYLCLSLI